MNCPNCQNHCIETDSFCIKCGFDLAKYKAESVDNGEKICPDCSAKCKAYDPTCLSCGYPFGEFKKPLPPPVKPTVIPVRTDLKPIVDKLPIHNSSGTTSTSSDSNRPLIISLVAVIAIVIVSFLVFKHYNGPNVDNPINSEADLKKRTDDSAMQSSNEITIGEQIWMLNNLDVTTFRNGDIIPEAKTDSDWEEKAKNHQPAWCYYNNDPSNGGRYGKLYNWYAVIDSRNLAPEGYHIPNNKEVWDMFSFFGYDQWASTQQSSNLAYTLYNKFLLPNNLGLRYDWGAFSDNPRKDEVTLWTIDGWKDSEDEYHPGKWGVADGFANGPGSDASSKAGMGLFIRCVKGEKPLPSNAIDLNESSPSRNKTLIYFEEYEYNDYTQFKGKYLSGIIVRNDSAWEFTYSGESNGDGIDRYASLANNYARPITDLKINGLQISFGRRAIIFGEERGCPYYDYATGKMLDTLAVSIKRTNPCKDDEEIKKIFILADMPEVNYRRNPALLSILKNEK